MQPVRCIVAIIAASLFVVGTTQNSAAQRLNLPGSDLTLTLGPPLVPGGDPQPVTDSSRRLMWLQLPRSGVYKVMVSTGIVSQSFQLFVTPTAVRNGTPGPTVELVEGMTPVDFVTDIARRPRPNGRATLLYRAEAPAESGSTNSQGSDVHTVIYIFTAQ